MTFGFLEQVYQLLAYNGVDFCSILGDLDLSILVQSIEHVRRLGERDFMHTQPFDWKSDSPRLGRGRLSSNLLRHFVRHQLTFFFGLFNLLQHGCLQFWRDGDIHRWLPFLRIVVNSQRKFVFL